MLSLALGPMIMAFFQLRFGRIARELPALYGVLRVPRAVNKGPLLVEDEPT
jgi:hypothetical protein